MRARKNGKGGGLVTWAVSAALAILATGLAGCTATGGGRPAPAKPSGGPPVTVEDGGDLADLSRLVKTREDQWVLDLLMGYRMLLLRNPDAKSLDKETLKRSRDAYDKLESLLRHGGVKSQDGGERVYTITNEDKLSLQEVLRSASQAANRAAREGDWEKARARWKEITQSKAAVAFAMEEAQWGLTLSDALQSALPDSLKRRLKEVNEGYLADVGHEEIGKQVKALLEVVPDVKLQRELKKLANRAWETDRKAGRISAQAQQAQVAAAAAGTVPPGSPQDSGKEAAPQAGAGAEPPAGANPPPGIEAAAILAEADSLSAKGKYVTALKTLERAGSDQPWVKEKKAQIGNRFCEEKRRSAANSFKDFKKASADADKRMHLKRTAADLDSCLFYFPELAVSQKVRKNREMVEGELKKIK
ncbi:MAG TPA: hypothetical protein VJ385_10330 [Fibrobacteria bacterium]|nr:hypothetical protein [Fibrobacteria bacterium]